MDFDRQLIVRIKAFLNATDLTDSATARELYNAYREISNEAARRVVECDVLMQKKQKIEAVLATRRQPELFEMIDGIIFPERKLLAELADLYNWPRWDDLDLKTVENLRSAVKGMDDLRPLLTEFRRIARTDQVEAKLQLLRDIYRMDNRNPEWREALSEVENQYLFRLIGEAQQAIEAKDDDRLLAIHGELHRTNWLVPIPTIVLQKIDKIAEKIEAKRIKEQSVKLLARISDAYGAFDTVALEDAMICWDKHCADTGYRPDDAESLQLREAGEYLKKSRHDAEVLQKFQTLIEQTADLIDRNAPLEEVEKCFSAALAQGQTPPKYLENRVAQYRLDIEHRRRTSAVLKATLIIGVSAVLIVIIAGGALLTTQYIVESKLTAALMKTIASGDLKTAQSMLADIEKKHPRLARNPRITDARARIKKLERSEEERAGKLNDILAEVDKLLENDPRKSKNARKIESSLKSARELAKSDAERAMVDERDDRAAKLFADLRNDSEDIFLQRIGELARLNEDAVSAIQLGKKTGDFTSAREKTKRVEALISEIRDMYWVRNELRNENRNILESGEMLRQMLENAEERNNVVARCMEKLADAKSIIAFEEGLRELTAILANSNNEYPPHVYKMQKMLENDLNRLKLIMKYQDDQLSEKEIGEMKSGFFADAGKLVIHRKNQKEAHRTMLANFEALRKEMDKKPLFLIRFVDSDGRNVDIYIQQGFNIAGKRFLRDDGTEVRILPPLSYAKVTTGNTTYVGCKLTVPHDLNSPQTIKASVAPHQRLIEKFHQQLLNSSGKDDILQMGIAFLNEVYGDPLCSPFWKMQLSVHVLSPLVNLDLTPDRELQKLLEAFQTLDSSEGDTSPLYDRVLHDKINACIGANRKKLNLIAAVNGLIIRRYRIVVERKYVYLGAFLNPELGCSLNPALQNQSGDVWCFDESGAGCRVVGRFSGSGDIQLFNKEFLEPVKGRLLFTTVPTGNIGKEVRELTKEPGAEQLKALEWPDFWPSNLRGE